MNKNKRKMVEGWIDKASNQLQAARGHLKSPFHYSEAIEASQECIELSVKSILLFLNIKYAPSHGWEESKKQFADIAKQIISRNIQEKLEAQYLHHSIRLPRLILLVNFWSLLYLSAKYGFTAEYLSSARDLFDKKEAELAVEHADECYRAVSQLRYLSEDKLASIVLQP